MDMQSVLMNRTKWIVVSETYTLFQNKISPRENSISDQCLFSEIDGVVVFLASPVFLGSNGLNGYNIHCSETRNDFDTSLLLKKLVIYGECVLVRSDGWIMSQNCNINYNKKKT